jgi:hypothetical protein
VLRDAVGVAGAGQDVAGEDAVFGHRGQHGGERGDGVVAAGGQGHAAGELGDGRALLVRHRDGGRQVVAEEQLVFIVAQVVLAVPPGCLGVGAVAGSARRGPGEGFQVAPVRGQRAAGVPEFLRAIAFTSPAWSSLVTMATPDRPRAARPRRNASHPAPSSELVTSMPRISRYPSALTPVAIRQCTFTVRPPSRTFWVSASIQQNVYGPASSGRFRNPSTSSSSSAAMALTCDFDSPTTPREAASFSTRRVETPAGTTWPPPRPAPAQRGGGAPGTTGSTTRTAASGRPAPRSPPAYPTPAAGTRSASSPGPASPPRTPRYTGPRRQRPSSAGRTPGSSPAAHPGSPMPGSPRTARREPAQCHLRPLRSPSLHRIHFEGSRGGRLPSRLRRTPAKQSHQYRLPHTPLPWT